MNAPAAEWAETSSLKPWGKNPRRNDAVVKRIADSIRRFGFGAPLVARRENREIIAGHTRWKAAKLLGMKTVPVRFLDVSERDAHLLALADNKLGELAEWDTNELGKQLSESSFSDALLAGWSGDALGDLASAIIGEQEASGDGSAKLGIKLTYSVVVECESESHQAELLARLESEGLHCKPLIV